MPKTNAACLLMLATAQKCCRHAEDHACRYSSWGSVGPHDGEQLGTNSTVRNQRPLIPTWCFPVSCKGSWLQKVKVQSCKSLLLWLSFFKPLIVCWLLMVLAWLPSEFMHDSFAPWQVASALVQPIQRDVGNLKDRNHGGSDKSQHVFNCQRCQNVMHMIVYGGC